VSFRTRVSFAAAIVVAIAVALACFVSYRAARNALIGSADTSLTGAYESMSSPPFLEPGRVLGFDPMLVSPSGRSYPLLSGQTLPIDSTIIQVASGKQPAQFRTIYDSDGTALRELIEPVPQGTFLSSGGSAVELTSSAALVLVEPFQGIEDRLRSLGDYLLALAAFGVLVAALFGWLAARAALVPLAETTSDIEEVATTLDVSHRMNEGSPDELGRLRRAFNRLLEALEGSLDAQRQLILDASHELRTPLTSLRANAQVLRRIDELDGHDVAQLSVDMVAQVDELTRLVGDLTELARGEHTVEPAKDFDLGELVSECAEIAETHARTKLVGVEVDVEPCMVHGSRERVVRAVGNLLDNAIKFSPEGGHVAVTCRGGVVAVDDDGPGIDDADLPFVFDRFYRSSRDRGLPGSGLGLAIVAQVTEGAGGTVTASRSERLGGARFELRLPVVATAS
jgi:two-component system, OmpR family, sensor histidine kinase MprB